MDDLEKSSSLWKVKKDSALEKHVLSFVHQVWGVESSSGYFPGPQPVSIERKHFPILRRSEYLVCEKSDGVRHLFVVLKYGDKKMCIMMNRANDMFLAPLNLPKIAYDGTVLDGELVQGNLLLVYDAVYVAGTSVRNLNLIQRMEHANRVVKNIMKLKTDIITIKCKTFYNFKNFESFQREFLPTLTYKTDGLVFTPLHEPIRVGTHETMFKWKPRDLNTIDFQVKGNRLYLQEKGRLVYEGDLRTRPEWIAEDCIVECQYSGEHWVPQNLRPDKTHPNNRRTFYRTLQNIKEDIQISEFMFR
jgi:mRNA capping enzyme, catalytic domain/mRNA capping enzyme, C-terminal domain